MLIYFPSMHVELLSSEPVPGAFFFDPGLRDEQTEGYFRPDALPVTPAQGQALIRDCMSFGEQFKSSSEMAFFGAHTPDEYFNESAATIKNELLMRLKGEDSAAPEVGAANAQFTLMLAWHLEDGLIETRGLEKGVRASWDKFGESLGMDEGEDEQGLALGKVVSSTTPGSGTIAFPWQRVMEALPAFLPEDAVLVTGLADAFETWQEHGIEFSPAPDALNLPEGTMLGKAPAWKLAGRKNQPEQSPWTAREVRVAVVKS